jgi:hypothetical protein
MIVCGIDPDTKGGVAFVSDVGDWEVHPMPHIDNLNEMMSLLWVSNELTTVYIEAAHGAHRKVVELEALWRGLAHASDIDLVRVSPQQWKGWWGIRGDRKAHSTAIAKKKWPSRRWRQKDHGLAESLMIATYGMHRELKKKGQ